MRFNFHTHSHYSDGSAPPETYIQYALEKGFESLGFTDHAPLPFKNSFAIQGENALKEYCDEINRLKEKYRGRINIFLGLEVDYIRDEWEDLNYFREHYDLDYIIGSVHLISNTGRGERWFIDGPLIETFDEGLHACFDGDIKAGATAYYRHIKSMIRDQKPEVVGHLDKVRMHNGGRYFQDSDNWYVELQEDVLQEIKRQKTIVEVNTRGLYKNRTDDLFPADGLLRRIYELDIPITLSSDAHRPEELDKGFEFAMHRLKDIGFKSLMVLAIQGWKPVAGS